MSNSQLSGKVQTVLGPVDPSTLGMTSMHEHVLIDFVCMYTPSGKPGPGNRGEQKVSLENLGWVR